MTLKTVFHGIVSLQDLDRKTIEFEGDQKTQWIRDFVASSAPLGLSDDERADWIARAQISVAGRVEKVGSDYLLRAQLRGAVPADCSRCGDSFLAPREANVQTVFHRRSTDAEDQEGADLGDADYVPVSGPDLDLREPFREQLVFLEPVAECPARQKDGSCTLCLKNPQYGSQSSGQQEGSGANSPFSKLALVDFTVAAESGLKNPDHQDPMVQTKRKKRT